MPGAATRGLASVGRKPAQAPAPRTITPLEARARNQLVKFTIHVEILKYRPRNTLDLTVLMKYILKNHAMVR
jgi:hypothetical protein